MRYIKRIILLFLSVLLLLSVLSACSQQADNAAEEALSNITQPPITEPPAAEPSPEPAPAATPYNGPINPLTGEECEKDYTKLRPYAVMINNIEIATPQSGISKADIVYECLAEGGITRNLAVFQNIYDAGIVGSIRSARLYFVDIADSYDAIFIHAGSSPTGYSEIDRTGIQNIDGVNGASDIFFRDKTRKSHDGYEHSLMFDSSLIPDFEIKYKLDTAHKDGFSSNLTFTSDAAPTDGGTADEVSITFSSKSTSFKYNPEDRLYYAYEYGSEYMDIENGVQLAFTNVLVLKTSVSAISDDDKGRIETVTTGTGSGYFICGGKYAEINWSREEGGQFAYTYSDGTSLNFGTGKSYIAIIPSDKKVNLS
jgi:hypothetical protein